MRPQASLSQWKSARHAILLAVAFASIPSLQAEDPENLDRLRISAADMPQKISDIDGNLRTPLAPEPGQFSLLLFTATECPIANAFSPEISRIAEEFSKKKFEIYLIYTDPELDAAAVKNHVKDYSLKPVVPILDIEQRLVRATGATHTPEAAVIDSKGSQLYRGRINNRFAALGKARRVITEHDLRGALDAVVAGKAIDVPRTKVIGCYIPTPLTPSTK